MESEDFFVRRNLPRPGQAGDGRLANGIKLNQRIEKRRENKGGKGIVIQVIVERLGKIPPRRSKRTALFCLRACKRVKPGIGDRQGARRGDAKDERQSIDGIQSLIHCGWGSSSADLCCSRGKASNSLVLRCSSQYHAP